MAPISAAVLLHERYQETARHLIVLWVIILLQQRDLILRVDPKRVCTDDGFVLDCFIATVILHFTIITFVCFNKEILQLHHFIGTFCMSECTF